jgi:hypothetical protein
VDGSLLSFPAFCGRLFFAFSSTKPPTLGRLSEQRPLPRYTAPDQRWSGHLSTGRWGYTVSASGETGDERRLSDHPLLIRSSIPGPDPCANWLGSRQPPEEGGTTFRGASWRWLRRLHGMPRCHDHPS